MDYDNIRTLLKKYWEGETNLWEEKSLKEFFCQAVNLPEDLETGRDLFCYYKQENNSAMLTDDMTAKLRQHWGAESQQTAKKIPVWRQALKYAAVLVLMFLLGYIFIYKDKGTKTAAVQTDTFTDPQKAIAETEKALLLLSKNMNDGMSKIEALEFFDKIKQSKKGKDQKGIPPKF